MFEPLIVLILAALSLALIGNFVFLRRLAMLGDAISHSVLLGIVLAFFIYPDFGSPLFLIFSTLVGLLTAFLIQKLSQTRLVSEDAAIGLVYPFLFSIAVILISRFARNVHLDTDVVLMGEVLFTPLQRLNLFGIDLPQAAWRMLALFGVEIILLILFYRPLKLSSFDPAAAKIAGFHLGLISYALVAFISLALVSAFDAVGSILAISFLVVPAATAYLLSKRLWPMLMLSLVFAAGNATLAYALAVQFNLSVSGMAAFTGMIIFLLVSLFCRQGLIARRWRRKQQIQRYRRDSLLLHLLQHQDSPQALEELGLSSIHKHLAWSKLRLNRQIYTLRHLGYLEIYEAACAVGYQPNRIQVIKKRFITKKQQPDEPQCRYYRLSPAGRQLAQQLAKRYQLNLTP